MSCCLSSLLRNLAPSWAYVGPLAHLGGSVGPCWGVCWPFGPILGPCWELCWPILGAPSAYFGPEDGSKQRSPKNVPTKPEKRSRQRPAGRPRAPLAARKGPKTELFWQPQRRRSLDIPTCLKKHSSDKSIQNPFHAATSEKSRFLGPPWPLWAPCWPVLGAVYGTRSMLPLARNRVF